MFDISKYINLPKNCALGSIIFKKHFYENVPLNKVDRELFTNNIEKIKWDYCLKSQNINIKAFKENNKEYNEVEFLTVQIRIPDKTKRIAEIIMRSIPYPMVLIFENDNKIQFFTADQSINLADKSKNTLEELIFTLWIDLDNLDDKDKQFFSSLNIKNLNFNNFYLFYKDIMDKIIKYNAIRLTGRNINLNAEQIKVLYDNIKFVDNKIEIIKNRITEETQFNRQLEMNVQIKELERKKNYLLQKLT
jgi:hypothetical protein